MADFRSASFCLICFLICFLICSSGAQEIIPADLGEDVILPCKVPNINKNIIRAVEWSRPDLDPEYVLVYRDGRIDLNNQHPSYQNRVDLQDRKMKDGNVSLILMNAKMEDTGKYECWAFQKETNRRKRSDSDLISITILEIRPPGNKDGNTGDGGDKTGIIVGSVVGVILLVVLASVGFLIYRRLRRHHQHRSVPPDEPTVRYCNNS